MQRNESWNALLDAAGAVVVAMVEWTRAATPANRFDVEKTTRAYMNSLSPVIGHALAFQYGAAFQHHLDAIDRQERFLATLAGRSTTDESDALFAGLLQGHSETARQAFEAAQVALQTKLAEVAERDGTSLKQITRAVHDPIVLAGPEVRRNKNIGEFMKSREGLDQIERGSPQSGSRARDGLTGGRDPHGLTRPVIRAIRCLSKRSHPARCVPRRAGGA